MAPAPRAGEALGRRSALAHLPVGVGLARRLQARLRLA